ncbi:MAG: bifunctional shikimate kinase/3-dehydroquinate synthase [Actinomycetota bacterium]|nr:bifunctional shikimate kinase/3-dehydroquinate synthase [Actinomycetota bacterium]
MTARPFVDLDEEIERRHGPIPGLFERSGEAEFRRIEGELATEALCRDEPSVVALGGGALTSPPTRERLARRAFTVRLTVDVGEAWRRVQGSDRPLVRTEDSFRRLFDERAPVYEATADAAAAEADGVVLAALAIEFGRGLFGRLSSLVEPPLAVVADERVLALHPVSLAGSVHRVPPGEEAKTLALAERLWEELPLDRGGTIVALGGGATTDVAGFVAATHLRGVRWVAVPTTLVGQTDAAIGGKTAINVGTGKNRVGAFHLPARVVVDPDLVATLPASERRAGLAEVVKTGLLAGSALWELPEEEMIRRSAAFKAAVVLSDPEERGRRAILNLGHTFAHALEAASEFRLSHAHAVALGLLAALRLSGLPTDVVEEVLGPRPVRVDPARAWAALERDKKNAGGRRRLVLLERPGKPVFPAEVPDGDVRRELEALIAT